MQQQQPDQSMDSYREAVKSGLYAKKTGLVGKYDNVRRYWEDEITRQFLHPYLRKTLVYNQSRMRRLRILDLGCGSADGYDLLAGIRDRDAGLHQVEVDLLTPEALGLYKGVDLSGELVEQARSLHDSNPKMVFERHDFEKGLPIRDGQEPFDLYFTSYGTCSHFNNDGVLADLLADIARCTKQHCLIVCDWLGRWSYEWQDLWSNDLSESRSMDYVVSYIYEKGERQRRRDKLKHLNLRLMSRGEAEAIIRGASDKAGVPIKPLVYFDRSTFTGRHMDTAEYNPHAQPVRQAVNSLHEVNMRTDLSSLVINYVPKEGFDSLNNYFERLQICWNSLVRYTGSLLEAYDEKQQRFAGALPEVPGSLPQPVQAMMARMKQVVEGVGWLGIGLPRENIIEPQLGYALRYLSTKMQQGQGCAHNLVGVFEIVK